MPRPVRVQCAGLSPSLAQPKPRVVRTTYNVLVKPGVRWSQLVERYAYNGREPNNAKVSCVAAQLGSTPFSTYAGFDEGGMYIQRYGMFSDTRPIKIPWENLRLDWDGGLLVILMSASRAHVFHVLPMVRREREHQATEGFPTTAPMTHPRAAHPSGGGCTDATGAWHKEPCPDRGRPA